MIQCHCETFSESNNNIKIYPNFTNSYCSLKLIKKSFIEIAITTKIRVQHVL